MTAVNDDRRTMVIALSGATLISFAPLLYIQSGTAPLTGAFFRMFYALPMLAALVWLLKRNDLRNRQDRMLAFGAGVLLAIDFIGYHSAIDFIGSGIATMIGNSQVIIVTLASWWLFGEKPNRYILFSLPMVMLGLLLISGIWDENPYGSDPVKGVIGGVVAAIFYSSFLILYRYSNRAQAPSVNLQLDATAGAASGILFVGLLPLSSAGIEPLDFSITWPGHGWLLILAFSCQVIGWIAITYALPRLPAAHTSFAVLLQPILTILWGILLLAEQPSTQQALGMLLIFSAIIAVTLFGRADNTENRV
ncbi:MAG TPA: DMT family transporter [Candidatus Thalassarchaeaceae archaeon]|jgi:drug/metabolite transporter (DMT)-like permease|nr:DMT family transporter [Candidatus Thalassarchaeaceae archaeon]HJL64165.1 DMT family transporter [Candidatus Thalassarchaeaceae archaeon]